MSRIFVHGTQSNTVPVKTIIRICYVCIKKYKNESHKGCKKGLSFFVHSICLLKQASNKRFVFSMHFLRCSKERSFFEFFISLTYI